MSSEKPLDIGRFSVHGWKYLKIKGLKDSFLWIPAFAGMTKGREWLHSFFPFPPSPPTLPFDELEDLPIPKFVEPAMC